MKASSVRPTAASPSRSRSLVAALAAGAVVLTTVSACTSTGGDSAQSVSADAGTDGSVIDTASTTSILDSSIVHTISVDVDPDTYQAMIDTYVDSGEKEWISATVTINGTAFTDVGIKLKGNSSLMGLRGRDAAGPVGSRGAEGSSTESTGEADPSTPSVAPSGPSAVPSPSPSDTSATTASPTVDQQDPGARPGGFGPGTTVSADEPEGLPWRIRLDKFVDGQNYQGETDIVVRANNSETSLNEAVALELIGAAGLPTQEAAAVKFSVNGSDQQLRLALETPDDDWYADTVGVSGILYKAEAGGDYSYRGDDPAAYTEVFEVEANTSAQTESEYAPLIAFLKWLNESDDATFAAELDQWLDIDSFADYLAIQDLVANFDDIDGPGNNSYLSYDEATGLFSVISWDQNLAFGGMGGGGMGGGMGGNPQGQLPDGVTLPEGFNPPEGFVPPTDMQLPEGMELPEGMPTGGGPGGGFGGGGIGGGNVLSEKFTANEQFAALVTEATTTLRAELYGSGKAQQILDTWTATLQAQATDLVPTETINSESSSIGGHFTA